MATGTSSAEASQSTKCRLRSALERYEGAMDAMLARWPDMSGYSVASVGIDEVRLYSGTLPSTSVPFLALLIARTQLFDCLFAAGPQPTGPQVADCARGHAAAVAELHRKCAQLLK